MSYEARERERECQPDETINSMIKRAQPKPRRSRDRVKVSLLIVVSIFFVGSRSQCGQCSQKYAKTWDFFVHLKRYKQNLTFQAKVFRREVSIYLCSKDRNLKVCSPS